MNDDLISRQAVIDGINVYFHDDYYQRTSIQDCRDCLIRDVIKALPPVTPQEPKTGHWIEFEQPINNYATSTRWKCNICDGRVEYRSNYCPNCGARMAEPQESEVNNE